MTFRRFPPFKWPELGVPLTPRAGCGAREDMAREDDFAKRLKDMGYEACGLGSK